MSPARTRTLETIIVNAHRAKGVRYPTASQKDCFKTWYSYALRRGDAEKTSSKVLQEHGKQLKEVREAAPGGRTYLDFIAPLAINVERVENGCPTKTAAGQSLITTWDKSQYLCEDDTNYKAGDITGLIAYSLQDCADACATYAKFNGGCDSFTHDADIARSYQINNGANCWLKNSRLSGGSNRDSNGSSARLVKA